LFKFMLKILSFAQLMNYCVSNFWKLCRVNLRCL